MTYAEERHFLAKANQGDQIAIEKLIKANLPVISTIAAQLSQKPEIQKELIQEGLIYLLYAIRSYKPEGRKRLIRFAIKGIIEHMKMFADRYERISNLDTKVSVTVKVNKLQTWEKSQNTLSRKEKIDELQIYKAEDCDDRDHYLSQLENLISGNGEEIVKENHIITRQELDDELIRSRKSAYKLI